MILLCLEYHRPPSRELPVTVFNLESCLLSILLTVRNFNLVNHPHRCFYIALLFYLSVSLVFNTKILSSFVVGFEFFTVGFSVGCYGARESSKG